MTAKFELYKDKAGGFRFRLRHQNGEIIASGEGYTTKANALNGIESVKKNAPDAPIKDLIVKEEKTEAPIEDLSAKEEKLEAPASEIREAKKSGIDWLVIGLVTLFVAWLIYLIFLIVIT